MNYEETNGLASGGILILGFLIWGGAAVNVTAAAVTINQTNFPDKNFRSYVNKFDSNGDGVLSDAEIKKVSSIEAYEKGIRDLTGIGYFTQLTELDCSYNGLTSVNVSKNTLLVYLNCSDNQLSSLDVSKNTKLTSLECYGNQLTKLDVSKNTKLTSLYCNGNQLTSLNVSKNTALAYLNCAGNQLTSLDVSANTKLVFLSCAYNQLKSLNLSKNTALQKTNLHCDSSVSVTWPHKHTGTLHKGKAATCGAAGVKSYYTCTCGKAFKDAACTKEITNLASWKVIAATGKHTLKTKTTAATLKKNGSVKSVCTVCNKVTAKKTIYRPKKIKLSKTVYTYNGKKKTPSVKVTDAAGKKIASGNYKVTYSSGRKNVGKYTVKITFKGKKYSGTKKLTFRIIPKGTSISKITAGKKKLTVKWKKQTKQTTGYQIQYSLKKNFKNGKTVTVKKAKTTSKVLKKLQAKKKYYVRIRTYKKKGGKKYYSSWSKAKTAKTKK